MRINIYYGGRGIVGDPCLYVIAQMESVLKELNVEVERFNIYEQKNAISTLPQTLKNADGVILASTVEWYGIGGYMMQFLDACWLYADKEKIASTYMCPIVMSTTYGEKSGKQTLINAWETLGGLPTEGICGYFTDTLALEMNAGYKKIIEKLAENLYRTINQKPAVFPSSNMAVKQRISLNNTISLTPQETEQLSIYVADDHYVQKQKEDIQELTSLFKEKLIKGDVNEEQLYLKEYKDHFSPQAGFQSDYCIRLDGRPKALILQVKGTQMKVFYGESVPDAIEVSMAPEVMDDIVGGRMTFQRAFMTGLLVVKGDFKYIRSLDQVFPFMSE